MGLVQPTAWVVQTNVEAESTSPALLRDACAALSLPFYEVSVTRGQASLPSLPEITGPAVFHGRNTLMSRALEHPHWQKAVFFSAKNFCHDAYVAGYGTDLLNADARVMSLDELLTATQLANSKLFVRPLDDSKLFTGRVIRFAERAELERELRGSSSPRNEPALVVAEVQELDAEWRLFIVDGKVTAGSMYRPTAERTLPAELSAFAEHAAERWSPAPVFVMDVARVSREWKIVECNCFNGSRFYESNVTAVVRAVSEYQARHW